LVSTCFSSRAIAALYPSQHSVFLGFYGNGIALRPSGRADIDLAERHADRIIGNAVDDFGRDARAIVGESDLAGTGSDMM